MKEVSFDVEEGRSFSRNDVRNDNNFSLFRDRPFLRISRGKYLPIEGKLVEELLFENLFHRVYRACERDGSFFAEFGRAFEGYAQEYVRYFLGRNNHYQIIDEFSYDKGGSKSPDLMIKIPDERAMIVIEVKSARPLDDALTTNNNKESVEKTLQKLQSAPWMQSYNSVCNILKKKGHVEFTADTIYYFLSVTMNNIPFMIGGFSVKSKGFDLDKFFYSVDIETFELLVRFSSTVKEYSIRDTLLNYNQNRGRMSMKTYVLKVYKKIHRKMDINSTEYIDMINSDLIYHMELLSLAK